jgi:hypothetical protein
MNERDDEAPFPREPWQRLLEDSSDAPPETTDARIRAKARRDLAPRGHHWWLPAALAASLVLAVVIVRSEFGSGGRIHYVSSTETGEDAMQGRPVERNEGEQAREPGRSPTATELSKEKPREAADSDVYGHADSELGQEDAGTGPRVGGPERERRSASEAPEERMEAKSSPTRTDSSSFASEPAPAATPPTDPQKAAVAASKEGKKLDQVTVTGSRAQEAQAPSSWTPTHVAAPVDDVQPRSAGLVAKNPTPQAWYAAIEKLRADGRTREADRELEKLKNAYPGWLEQHLKQQKKP